MGGEIMREVQTKTGVTRTRRRMVWLSHLMVSMLVIASSFFVLTPTRPVLAEVFSCPSGDVFCLIDAINMANATDKKDKIILSAGTYILTEADNYSDSYNGNGLPSITSEIAIIGAGADNTIIDVDEALRIFHVADTGTLVINGLTVQYGHSWNDGGCVFNRGTLKVNNSTFSHCFASAYGGGIYNEGGSLIIKKSTFSHCWGDGEGGPAIWNEGGTMLITESSFTENFNYGGRTIANSCGTAIIRFSTISDNAGDFGGMGVYNDDCGEMIISHSDISGNTVWGKGGGILNEGNLIIKHSTVSDNQADDTEGGGICNFGRLVIKNNSISNNTGAGPGGGGGIYNTDTLSIQNSIIAGNTAGDGNGGGISNDGGTITLKRTAVVGNDAPNTNVGWGLGGGIYNTDTLTANKSIISGNTAANDGGGIYNDGGTVTLMETTVADNNPNDCVGCQ